MSHYTPIDRFTLPGDIPDAAGLNAGLPTPGPSRRREGSSGATQSPSRKRGTEGVPEEQRLGVGHSAVPEGDSRLLSHPAGRGWQPVGRQRLPGEPPAPSSVDGFAALLDEAESPRVVFSRALQVRFLDRLATCGNVRAACACAGVSPHTAYKARRRDAALARLWDAALVLARPHAEAVLAGRALDGVEVPVFYHGEVVAYRRHYDGRLLLAHLARLDRAAEQAAPEAHEAAERFDEFLALHLGVEPDEALVDARVNDEGRDGMPGTLEEVVELARARAIFGLEAEGGEVEPHEADCECEACEYAADPEDWDEEPLSEVKEAALDEAEDGARALWAGWQEAALAAVDAVLVDPPQGGEGDHPQDGGGAPSDGVEPASPTPNRRSSGTPSVPPKPEGDTVSDVPLPSRLREGAGVGPAYPATPLEPCHPVTPLAAPRL